MSGIANLRVLYEGKAVRLEQLPTDELIAIYQKHKASCSPEELDLALGSSAPIPDGYLVLLTLRRVDEILAARSSRR